jgi:hypothetical protein
VQTMKEYVEWGFNSNHSLHYYLVAVNGQVHAPTSLSPGESDPVTH